MHRGRKLACIGWFGAAAAIFIISLSVQRRVLLSTARKSARGQGSCFRSLRSIHNVFKGHNQQYTKASRHHMKGHQRRQILASWLGAGLAFQALPLLNPKVSSAKPGTAFSLLSADPISDPKELLRRALPVHNPLLDSMQEDLFSLTKVLGVTGNMGDNRLGDTVRATTGLRPNAVSMPLSGAQPAIDRVKNTLSSNKEKIANLARGERRQMMSEKLDSLELVLEQMNGVVSGDFSGKELYNLQQRALDIVGELKETTIEKFPFSIPEEYSGEETLKGRATAQIRIRSSDKSGAVSVNTIKLILDGYNAPITAGRFVQLASNGFYDDLEIQRADGFVVQSGKRTNKAVGSIPLEIKVEGQTKPIYGNTLEALSRFDERTVLPFNAFGTLAMSRDENDANSGNSEFFWLLKDSDMTPSGTNLLDGRYAVFGYAVENARALADLKVGDVIESVQIIDGMENFFDPVHRISKFAAAH